MTTKERKELIDRCDRYIALYEKRLQKAGDESDRRLYQEAKTLKGLLEMDRGYTVTDEAIPGFSRIKVDNMAPGFHLMKPEELDQLEAEGKDPADG